MPGVVRDVDTEFLHDLRIAVRWTRSALKLCGSALPDGLARSFRPEFRWLGDLTTPTRDLDVYLLGFSGMAAGLVSATEIELAPFRDYLLKSRAVAYRQLARGLRSARFAQADRRLARRAGGRPACPQAPDRRAACGCQDRRGAPCRPALRTADHRVVTRAEPARLAQAVQGVALRGGDVRVPA